MNVIWDVCPEVEEARRLLEKECSRKGKDLVVTSANDSQHSNGSLHPSGKAFDIRKVPGVLTKNYIHHLIKHIGFQKKDIISKSWGFHIEYDVK
jgi:hypothetical protein